MRRECPVARVRLPHGGDAWLVTGHPESKVVLSDPRFSRAAAAHPDSPRFTPRPLPAAMLQNLDPPEHTRLRGVVAQAFTAHQVERLRARTEALAEELLDQVAERGPGVDLVEALAFPMPMRTICNLLGVPYDEREHFERYSDALLSTTAFTEREMERATGELHRYIAELIARRRREPGADLLSTLVRHADPDSGLGEPEMVMLGVVVLVGGYETTACQLSCILHTLLSVPERYTALCEDPGLIPGAVAELVRYIPLGAAGSFPRVATSDVELGGAVIRAGDAVVTHAGSANRDERVFPAPDELDFTREDNPHLGFGHGPHHCLGSRLAAMELRTALRALVRRFPGLRLAAPPQEIAWKDGIILRGPVNLPVAW
nr:cytochrome P450 [Streptomyces boncukensis]